MISTAATATCKQAGRNYSTLLFSSTPSRPRTRIRRTTDLLVSCHYYYIPSSTYTALRTNVALPIGHNSSHFYRQHSSPSQLSPFPMPQTRSHSTKQPAQAPVGTAAAPKEPAHDHTHEHNHDHDHAPDHEEHSHSHSLFGHSHSHGPEAHTRDAEQIIAAIKGSGDRGSYITLVGLFSNIILTGAKGLAGWYLHSASLLADAGHSLSDLLGDFVTLFCWKLSRKPPSETYPYGFAKFETVGTTTISLLLIGGALGIGFHSYHLLIVALSETATTLSPGHLQEFLQFITSSVPTLPAHMGHEHAHGVDINAAWFAAGGVVSKEWLYRITKKVADDEHSPVLLANAIHHRSDAYSSLVAFFAIIGTWMFPAFPLDPLGGKFPSRLVVSVVILQQGFGLLAGAWGDLTDAGAPARTRKSLRKILEPLVDKTGSTHLTNGKDAGHIALPPLMAIQNLRARKAGSMMFVDLTVEVPGCISVSQSAALEQKIESVLKGARKEISEVHVTFRPTQEEKPKQS
ncbi:hypothetical protein D9619_001880 [Psilocybe cf. subviscida]|uniref:Cation efflux protein cytoplasmic domain-containing protein n=1 Tax=Psilocybe cf. subviscida TaxID=2480587 RepID=A0A8H5BDH2_9AGAR|nr:hypothetical protein D9619_001880 [Psilocybe cf. subviscida]